MPTDDPVYLCRIEIENFRGFAERTVVDLQPRAGVVVLAGPNGLGKTSLLESIEWVLTGTVRRLAAIGETSSIEPVLTTRGCSGHRCGVTFIDKGKEVSFERPLTAPSDNRIARVLARPDWPRPIKNISSYLAMTHILSQSPFLRLTHRTPEQRFSEWDQPCDLDRVDRIRRNIDRARRDLRHLQDQHKALLQATESDLGSLCSLLQRKRAITVAATDTMAPDQILDDAQSAATSLAKVLGEPRPALADCVEDALQQFAVMIARADSALSERNTALRTAMELLKDFDLAQAEQASGHARLQKTLESLEDARNAERQAADETQDICEQHQAKLADHRALEAARNSVTRELGFRRQLVTWEARRASAETNLTRYRADETACRTRIACLREAAEKVEGLAARQAQLRAWREDAQALEAAERRHHSQQVQHQENKIAVTVERERLRTLQEKAEKLSEAVSEKNRAEAADLEKTIALAQLKKHIRSQDTSCLLCESVFPAGEIKNRVKDRVGQEDKNTRSQRDLAQARLVEEENRREIKRCSEKIMLLDENIQKYSEIADDLELRRKTMLDIPEARDCPVGTSLANWFSQMLSATSHDLLQVQQLIGSAGAVAKAEEALKDAFRRVDDANSELAKVEQEVARIRSSLLPELAGLDEEGLRKELDGMNTLATVAAALSELARRQRTAERTLEEARHVTADLEGRVAKQQAEQGQANDRITVLRDRWGRLGMPDEPSTQSREKQVTAAEILGEANERARRELNRLKIGYQEWSNNTERIAVDQEVEKLRVKYSLSQGDLELHLRSQVDFFQKRKENTEKALADIEKWNQVINANRERFIQEVIDPLARRFRAFDDTWSVSYGREAVISANETGIALKVDNQEASRVLSEGQLGVKNLSLLLAASTTYRWSRWPALLLDEPTRDNDLLPKNDFLNVLRCLVKEKDYQVIMTTHDFEEAAFIRNKCRNAKIGVQVFHLRDNGPKGVSLHSWGE